MMAHPLHEGMDADEIKGYEEQDGGLTEAEELVGYCVLGTIDLSDMFGAFTQRQYGVVGGDKTVDDFTPEGVADRGSKK